MPAGIETYENGQTGFVTVRELPWWHLGHTFPVLDGPTDTYEAMKVAGLTDWNVRVEEVPLPAHYGTDAHIPLLTVRDRPGVEVDRLAPKPIDVLGSVGSRYVPFQNEQLGGFGDALQGEGGLLETAGSLHNGRVVFYTMKIDRSLVLDVDGVKDTTDLYLVVFNSHDGSKAITALITPVRVVCQNTLNFALSMARQSFKIRHTMNAGKRVDEARHALGMSNAYMDEFEAEAKSLLDSKVSQDTFWDIVDALYPLDDDASKAAVTRHANMVDSIAEFQAAPTNLPFKGTAWGAVNTLTERLDYGRNAHSEENKFAKASGFDPAANKERNRILSAVKSFV